MVKSKIGAIAVDTVVAAYINKNFIAVPDFVKDAKQYAILACRSEYI